MALAVGGACAAEAKQFAFDARWKTLREKNDVFTTAVLSWLRFSLLTVQRLFQRFGKLPS
jgi:hypothetical protein